MPGDSRQSSAVSNNPMGITGQAKVGESVPVEKDTVISTY